MMHENSIPDYTGDDIEAYLMFVSLAYDAPYVLCGQSKEAFKRMESYALHNVRYYYTNVDFSTLVFNFYNGLTGVKDFDAKLSKLAL